MNLRFKSLGITILGARGYCSDTQKNVAYIAIHEAADVFKAERVPEETP